MKNLWRVIWGLLLTITAAQAQFTYTTNNGSLTITGYTGPGGAVTIPATITGLPVAAIGIGVFDGNTALTSITIPGSVLTIGTNAFYGCTSLTNAQMGGGLTNIQTGAFEYCAGLVNLTIPASVMNLGGGAFYQCTVLTNLYFLGDAPAGGSSAFGGDPNTTIYCFPGATGWSSSFGGLTVYLMPFGFALNPANTNSVMVVDFWANGPTASANIPTTVFGLPVTAIASGAFAYNTYLNNVTIPDSVTTIGDGAFAYCTALASATISYGVASIGAQAFYGCISMKFYPLPGASFVPGSVTNIGPEAFTGCLQLNVSVSPQNSFYTNVSNVIFNKSQTVLVEGVASGNYVIPNTATNIAANALYGSGVTSITIPSSVTSIGTGAFSSCTSLTNISVATPNAFYSSMNGVLFDASQATLIQYPAGLGGSYTMPGSVTNIASEAFAAAHLTGITISSNVASIGDQAFFGCSSLTGVLIPSSVTNLGSEVFALCQKLTAITTDPQNAYYSSVSGVLYDHSQSTLIQYPMGAGASFSIPSGVTSINSGAFFQDSTLSSVTFPNGITNIGSQAFQNCRLLTGVNFPATLTSIGTNAFAQSKLGNVVLPNGVINVGAGAFQNSTLLASIVIPGSVTNLGENALADCYALTKVDFLGNAPAADASACSSDYNATNYFLPGTTGWTLPFAGATTMLWLPYSYSTNAGSITINSYTGLGGPMYIPAAINGLPVTSIGFGAFEGATTITALTIPTSVTNIGNSAFFDCTALTSATIAGNIVSLGTYAFQTCTGLTNVIFTSGVKVFGDEVFSDCRNLSAITLPNNVTNLWSSTFYGCTNLGSITIPNSVKDLGEGEFYACANLTNIYFAGNAPLSNAMVFSGAPKAAVYYLPGTTGWGSTFDGVPALAWLPQIQTGGGGFGVQSNQFGFNLNWASGQSVTVNVCTNLASPIWTPLQSITLTNGLYYFSEPLQTNGTGRYYQLSSP